MAMRIPALDLKKQIAPIRGELDAAIKKVIDNANFVFGQEIQDFEDKAAAYNQVKYAVGVSNGTDAISLALLAAGIKPGDGVICPAFTYYATAGAVAAIGAVPVFADIDPKTYNITAENIEKAFIKSKKIKIQAVIPVHLYGQCADMDSILKAAKKLRLKVVEDNAQAFGAEYKGKKAGTFGDAGTVSFFPGKNLGAFGDAGMVLTNDLEIADTLRLLRNQGNKEKYFHLAIGYNHRMDTLQAAVLQVKLKYIDGWNKKRQEIADYLNRGLQGLDIQTPFVAEHNTHIYHQYIFRVKSDNLALLEYLNNKGIDSRIFYPVPLHLQKCFEYLGYKPGDFSEAEKAAKQTVSLPVYPDLTTDELDYIIQSIKEFFHA